MNAAYPDLLPGLSDQEFEALKADIAKRGVMVPIEIDADTGAILDGYHRYKACRELGIEDAPTIKRKFENEHDRRLHALILNVMRRHLTDSQRAAYAVEWLPAFEEKAKERQGSRTDIVEKIPPSEFGKARDEVAQIFKTNSHYVSDAKAIKEKAPEKFEQVKAGTKTLVEAKREVKETERQSHRDENTKLVESAETLDDIISDGGAFSTVVVDPPWDWGDEGDVDQFGRGKPTYSTIPYDHLLTFPIARLADKDAHLYLWITNRSLPKGFALIEAWGFRYVTCLTWCKPSIGMGNYFRGSTEHLLFGVRGSLPLMRHDVGTWHLADRGSEHSAKPDRFFKLIETCSPGPYLELFGRKQRENWKVWGAEAA